MAFVGLLDLFDIVARDQVELLHANFLFFFEDATGGEVPTHLKGEGTVRTRYIGHSTGASIPIFGVGFSIRSDALARVTTLLPAGYETTEARGGLA